jgi:hypothetical protein
MRIQRASILKRELKDVWNVVEHDGSKLRREERKLLVRHWLYVRLPVGEMQIAEVLCTEDRGIPVIVSE